MSQFKVYNWPDLFVCGLRETNAKTEKNHSNKDLLNHFNL